MVKWSNISILPIDETLLGTTTLRQSGPGNNGNEGGLDPHHQMQLSVISRTHWVRQGVLPLCRDAVGVFYSFS